MPASMQKLQLDIQPKHVVFALVAVVAVASGSPALVTFALRGCFLTVGWLIVGFFGTGWSGFWLMLVIVAVYFLKIYSYDL